MRRRMLLSKRMTTFFGGVLGASIIVIAVLVFHNPVISILAIVLGILISASVNALAGNGSRR
jgi:uncharacterized membrane protein YdcZ (DUF606 family)